MTAYNGLYRCPGSKQPVRRRYKGGEFAVCHECDRGPLFVYSNGRIVMHKRLTSIPDPPFGAVSDWTSVQAGLA